MGDRAGWTELGHVWRLALLAPCVVSACSAATGRSGAAGQPSSRNASAHTAQPITPARCSAPIAARRAVVPPSWPSNWEFHPRRAELPNKLAELDNGHLLLSDYDGQRWFFDPKAPFQFAAPSSCSAIAVLRGKEWTFVKASGATCVAKAPLTAFTGAFEPAEPLRAAVVGTRIVAARSCGALIASDDAGASWQAVGPLEPKFVNVRAQADGSLLAQAEPPQLWSSVDGVDWRRAAGTKAAAEQAPVPELTGFSTSPKLAPSGEKLRRGEAAWFGKAYLEVDLAPPQGAHAVQLLHGSSGDRLQARALPQLGAGCALARISSFEHWVYLACAKLRLGDDEIALYRSDDGGQHFSLEPYVLRAKADELHIATGKAGALVLSGVCEGPKCEPEGIFHRDRAGRRLNRTPRAPLAMPPGAPQPRPGGPASKWPRLPSPRAAAGFDLFASTAPPLSGPVLALVASPDGKSFAALATTLGARHFVVLRSSDGGRTFLPTPVPELVPKTTLKPPRDMNGSADYQGATAAAFDDLGNATFAIENQWIVMLRYDGQLSVHKAPHYAVSLGVYGLRALAVDRNGQRAWESSDAGATWRSTAAPHVSCAIGRPCAWGIQCTDQLCFVGDDYTRLGWDTAG